MQAMVWEQSFSFASSHYGDGILQRWNIWIEQLWFLSCMYI